MSERTRLTLTMLGVASLGNLARAAVSPEGAGLALGLGPLLLLPLLPVAALCVTRPHPGVRWGAGLSAALAAAFCHFVLLDPLYNQDANIGLGLYTIGGSLVILGPAALLGGLIGRAALPYAELEPPLPRLAWQGWAWPLLLSVFGFALHVWSEVRLQERVRAESPQVSLPEPTWASALTSTLPQLLLWLGAATLPLALLRDQAQRRGQVQPWLGWWWAAPLLLTLGQFLLTTLPQLGE